MLVLIVGGSYANPGGVGLFCERAIEALHQGGQIRAVHIPAGTASLRPSTVGGFVSGLCALIRYRLERPDCVWLQYVNLPDLGYLLLAKILGMKVMVTPHLGSNWRSQRNPLLRNLSGGLLRLADRMALLSRTQELEIPLPEGVPRSYIKTFLPADLLESHLHDGLDSPSLRLIHAARLSEGKGTFRAIEVCALLRDRGVEFSMSIAGAADEETAARMHGLIVEQGLQNQIKVLGRLTGTDLSDELRRADVLIHLSEIDSYPLIVLEALACSVLPVCMELAGAHDMVTEYAGYVVQKSDAVDDAAALLACADPRDLRLQARDGGLRVRGDYSWVQCSAVAGAALHSTIVSA